MSRKSSTKIYDMSLDFSESISDSGNSVVFEGCDLKVSSEGRYFLRF